MFWQLINPTKLFMLHYLFVNEFFPVYLSPGRLYNLKKTLRQSITSPKRPPVFWLKESCFWMLPSKLLNLEFPVSKIGQARQKCICKVIKYWVCFDYELTLTSITLLWPGWDIDEVRFLLFTFCLSAVFLVFSKEIGRRLKRAFQSR